MKTWTVVFAGVVLVAWMHGCGGGSGGLDGGTDADGGTCGPGLADCGGVCVDISSDPDHCGGCGRACPDGQVCAVGACRAGCPEGLTDCDGACVDLFSSDRHCGACHHACEQPGAVGNCSQGTCVDWRCLPGWVDQDGDPSNGCEGTCAGRDIQVSGALDFDLETVHVSGMVTVDGQQAGPAAAGGTRGSLVFWPAGGGRPATVGLGDSGPATYRIFLLAGSYAVELENLADCPDGSFPCGTTVLRRGVELRTDGSLDFDVATETVETFEVVGEVTVNGAAMSASSTGAVRGRVRFTSDQGFVAEAELGTSGPAGYRVDLVAGCYRVEVDNPDDCPAGALPCQRTVVHQELELDGPGSLDLDLAVAEVSGVVTVNGAQMGPGATGAERARLVLAGASGDLAVGLGTSGPAAWQARLYAGSYDLRVVNTSDCPADRLPPVPCQTRTVRRGLALQGSGSLDLDLAVVEVAGVVSVNGEAMPDAPGGVSRGRLVFADDDGEVACDLGTAGAATYRVALHAGAYRVEVHNPDDCPPDEPGTLPCASRVVRDAVGLHADGVADFDLPVIRIQGAVTVDGAAMPSGEASRGQLVFTGEAGEQSRFVLEATGAAAYRVKLYPGTWTVSFDNLQCLDDAVPCQALGLRTVALASDGVLDLDLPVVHLAGQVTVNGEQMPPSPQGLLRGRVVFEESLAGAVACGLGASGPARYELDLFPGIYRVAFENTQDCTEGAVPCLTRTLREGLAVSGDGALDLDLAVVTIAGRVRVDGEPMLDSITGAGRGRLRFALESGGFVEAALGREGPASYSLELVPGSYSILFEGDDCPPDVDGAVPCQGALLEGCSP